MTVPGEMAGPWVGRRRARVNDAGPLHGTNRYIDDVDLAGTVHAAIVRSPVPHGILRGFSGPADTDDAWVFGPERLRRRVTGPLEIVWVLGDQTQHHTEVVDDHLRYVGQPIGVVVAGSRYAAEDLAELVELDIDDLDPVPDPDAALAPGASVLHPDRGSNVLVALDAGDPADVTDAVFAAADHTLTTHVRIGRVHGVPMEPRGLVAVPGPDGSLTVHVSTQTVHAVRDALCETLGLSRRRVRVIAPDVGGGFGLKDHCYEDEVMVAAAALELGRPVKWIEDRLESFLATTHARDERHRVDVAYDGDGTLRAIRVDAVRDAGGRLPIFGAGPLFAGFGAVPGPYRWEAVSCHGRVVATTTMSTGAYRGFGQTQGTMVREWAVDRVAAALDMDPVELRSRNMVPPGAQPYTTRTLLTFDGGDYGAALRRAADLVRSPDRPVPDDGRVRGIGFCSYVQMAGIGNSDTNRVIGLAIGGFETAEATMEPDGTVRVATGVSPHGQGHETTFAQLVADELGVDPDTVELVWGDTERAPYSAYGTAASRSIAVGGGAAVVAGRRLADQVRTVAAEMLEAAPADIELAEGRATVAGTTIGVTIPEVARRAWQGFGRPEGAEPGLSARHAYDPPQPTFSYATHACRVAVDRATGQVEVEDYVVVSDCGTIVNPTVVEGQIHGGVAQGLGAALLEEMVYDDQAQPQTSTMLDYHLPVSASLPDLRIEHTETPSPFTPGGMKGMGEGGTNGAFAAVVNAIADALPDADWTSVRTPLTPPRVWEAARRVAGPSH